MQIDVALIVIFLVLVIHTFVIFSLNEEIENARGAIRYLYMYLHKKFNVSADEIFKNGIYYVENQIDIFEEKENFKGKE